MSRRSLPAALLALLLAALLAAAPVEAQGRPARPRGPRVTRTPVSTATATALPAATPTPTPVPPTATPILPTATAVPPAATAAPEAAPPARPLLAAYEYLQWDEGVPGVEPADYDQTVYRPRQWAGANYPGWDWLSVAGIGFDTIRGGDLLLLHLNRAARVGIVWRGGAGTVPAWITGAYAAGAATTEGGAAYPVYLRDVAGGDLTLGAVKDAEGGSPVTSYRVLLAERGGTASVAPAQRGSPAAAPNATCPAWVHDQYATVVDGVAYATWHPQIDPEYWCYFRHEHGSDPAAFGDGGHRPAFGRAAAAAGIAENHEGFKVGVYTYSGYSWLLEMHFGTVNAQGAACNRFHEVGVAIAETTGGRQLLADVALMADTGKSVENTTHTPLTPVCNPGVNTGVASMGERLLPLQNTSGGTVFYEPWRSDFAGNVLGLVDTFTLNTPDPVAICADLTCSRSVATGLKGARRFYNVIGAFGVDASRAATTGVFYTTASGKATAGGPAAGAVRQYVRAGTNARQVYGGDTHTFVTADPDPASRNRFAARYRFEAGDPHPLQGNSVELEGSLSGAN